MSVSLTPPAFTTVYPPSMQSTVTIAGGTPPYSYVGSTNTAVAVGSVVGSTLNVSSTGAGTATLTVMDSLSAVAVVIVTVTQAGVPNDFTYDPFIPAGGSSQLNVFNQDVIINESYPGIIFEPTEPNSSVEVIREVAGDWWFVTNADWDATSSTWQQNAPNNPVLPAYAMFLGHDGSWQRLFAAATNAVSTPVTWQSVYSLRSDGSIFTTPLVNTASNRPALQLNPSWSDSSDIQIAFNIDVTDTASPSNSRFESFTTNGVLKWAVDKTGTLVVGNIPSSALPSVLNLSTLEMLNVPVLDNDGTNLYIKAPTPAGGIVFGNQTTSNAYGSVNTGGWDFFEPVRMDSTAAVNQYFTVGQNAVGTAPGDITANSSDTAGRVFLGGITHHGVLDFGLSTVGAFTLNSDIGVSTDLHLNTNSTGSLYAFKGHFTDAVIPGVGGVEGTAGDYSGSGVPAFSAPNGSTYRNFSGGAGSRFYLNTSGANTVGSTWTALA